MEPIYAQLTVYFEDPFWVGVLERRQNDLTEACKMIFGGEPTDGQVYEALLRQYNCLRFGPPAETGGRPQLIRSFKRRQRAIRRQLAEGGPGTKAQQALALQRQQGKQARQKRTREQKQLQARLDFQRKQQKRKEKRRGH